MNQKQANEVLALIEKAQFRKAFAKLDRLGVNYFTINLLREEFETGRYGADFYQRFPLVVQSLITVIDSNEQEEEREKHQDTTQIKTIKPLLNTIVRYTGAILSVPIIFFIAIWVWNIWHTSKDKDLIQKSQEKIKNKEEIVKKDTIKDKEVVKPLPKTEIYEDKNQANEKSTEQSEGLEYKIIKEIEQNMASIVGGAYLMGSPEKEIERNSNELQQQITINNFRISRYEVTQKIWINIMGYNPSYFKDCLECPVESITLDEIETFIYKINKLSNKKYRLPTSQEWEFACRAGTKTAFHTGDTLSTKQANYDGNDPYNGAPKGGYRDKTIPIGSFPPNTWGLYDMHGNIKEWTSTKGIEKDSYILRGGGYYSSAHRCRSAMQDEKKVDFKSRGVGFRLAL